MGSIKRFHYSDLKGLVWIQWWIMVIYVECNNLHKRNTIQRKKRKKRGIETENKILYKIYLDLKLYLTKNETWQFLFFLPFLGIWEVWHIIDSYLLLLYMCIICTYFHSTELSNPLYVTKTDFACFARAQLYISAFACKVLCWHSTLISKINSCINFNFCITIICYTYPKLEEYWNCDSLCRR